VKTRIAITAERQEKEDSEVQKK